MTTRFYSKVDWWYYLVIAFIALTVGYAFYVELPRGEATMPELAFAFALGIGLPVALLFFTYYEVGENELTVRAAVMTWKVPLKDIRSVTPTNSVLSSPALSMDRLEIKYGNKSVIVSPKDKDAFTKALGQ